MKKFFGNRRGSFTVFAAMLFCSLIILSAAAVKAAGNAAVASATGSFGRLWGKSILAEYDVFLKERYGIFGFYGDDFSTAEKLNFYAQQTAADKAYADVEDVYASVEDFRLNDAEVFGRQAEEAALRGVGPKIQKSSAGDELSTDRSVTAPWIKNSLPSAGKTEAFYPAELAAKLKSGLDAGEITRSFAVDRYIDMFFRNRADDKGLDDTYFICETEYIISGKLSDEAAAKSAGSKIKGLRNVLNLYYLYSCTEKREAAMALAELILPGAGAVPLQAVIMETWAYAEAVNDLKILQGGETVPLLKKDCNWALSLENVFNEEGQARKSEEEREEEKGYVSPQVTEGSDYSAYLNILLAGMTEETKLLRAMDLIEINAKYNYCDYFSLKDYCAGLAYSMKVNGNEYKFKESY